MALRCLFFDILQKERKNESGGKTARISCSGERTRPARHAGLSYVVLSRVQRVAPRGPHPKHPDMEMRLPWHKHQSFMRRYTSQPSRPAQAWAKAEGGRVGRSKPRQSLIFMIFQIFPLFCRYFRCFLVGD